MTDDDLTQHERVIGAWQKGYTNKQIAQLLKLPREQVEDALRREFGVPEPWGRAPRVWKCPECGVRLRLQMCVGCRSVYRGDW